MKLSIRFQRIIFTLGVSLTLSPLFAQPIITSFAPTSGPIETTVTLTGSGFDGAPENNVVFFGATRAQVSAASTTELTVTVPAGATYQPITVMVNNQLAYSSHPFMVTLAEPNDIKPGGFSDKSDYSVGANPISVALGDLDGDGRPDLVFANSGGSTVSVLQNRTEEIGVIDFATKMDFTTGAEPFDVAIGDLDADGKLDVVVTNSGDASVSILRNTSTGPGDISFAARTDFMTGGLPFAVSLADLDGDGKSDLATANLIDNSVSILRNISSGAGSIDFAPKVDFDTVIDPIDIAIGDLNEDGKLDIGIAHWGSLYISILNNSSSEPGVISFDPQVDIPMDYNARSVAIGDLDGDGKEDIAVTHPLQGLASVLRNTNSESGTASFSTSIELNTANGPLVIEIADINGDGKPDLATGNEGANNISVFQNSGAELGEISFHSMVNYFTGMEPWGLALGDLDADGRTDISTANFGAGTSTIWRNNYQMILNTSNLPIVIIETDDEADITKERLGADMKIVWNPAGLNDVSGPYNNYDGRIAIKGRGESSWNLFDKKGYTLETQLANGDNNNVSILGMPEENDWVLHGPFGDKTLMKNAFVYNLGRAMGRYAPRTRFCEVMLNGAYRGVYLFTEKIKIDKNRVDIATLNPAEVSGDDLTGGYIIRIDRKQEEYWEADFGFGESYFNYFAPDPESMPQVQKEYIKNYILDFEESLKNQELDNIELGYRSFINLPSFIDYFIINELTKNIDSYRLSTYMYKDKDSKGGKLTMGPIWDYNLSCGGINIGFGDWGATAENWVHEELPDGVPFWWEKFLEDGYYNSCLKKRWSDLRERLINDLEFETTIDEFAQLLDESKDRNFQIYPLSDAVWGNNHYGFNYEQEVDTLKEFLSERITWMDAAINSLPGGPACQECFENCEPQMILSTASTDQLVHIYPNPASKRITVRLSLPYSTNVSFELSDLAGRSIKIYEKHLSLGRNDWSIDFSSVDLQGLYLFRISTSSEVIHAGKLIVE